MTLIKKFDLITKNTLHWINKNAWIKLALNKNKKRLHQIDKKDCIDKEMRMRWIKKIKLN